MAAGRVAGLVLAAGGSSRLGRPKQLLPYAGRTLLDAVLDTARACPFDQLIIALGGSAAEVRAQVDLSGCDLVDNPGYGAGCSSSIAAALPALTSDVEVLVLLLGDQPGVSADAVERLLDERGDSALAVCRYSDGRGHPFAFGRTMFDELAGLHGDKAVWRLLEQHACDVAEVTVAGPVPADVDTLDDYERLLATRAIRH
jgi:molybdenum cofactor cytidylyltransferase